MKISQLHAVFDSTAQLCRDSGNASAAQSLLEFSKLFVGRETMTVSRFATLITTAASAEDAPDA
jgi:hypothetical protein